MKRARIQRRQRAPGALFLRARAMLRVRLRAAAALSAARARRQSAGARARALRALRGARMRCCRAACRCARARPQSVKQRRFMRAKKVLFYKEIDPEQI